MTYYYDDELNDRGWHRPPLTRPQKDRQNAAARRKRANARRLRQIEREQYLAYAAIETEQGMALSDAMDALAWPNVVTLPQLHAVGLPDIRQWRKRWRAHLAVRDYYPFPNPFASDRKWFIPGTATDEVTVPAGRTIVYILKEA
jgi:hypothetical protein